MNQGNNPNDDINLDLSLRIGPREEDLVEEQGPFLELLRSENNSPSHTLQPSSPTNSVDLTLAIFPIPPVENISLPALSPPPQLNQAFPSMQVGCLETPNIRLTLGWPPVENGSFTALPLYQQSYQRTPLIQPGCLETPNTQPRLCRPPTKHQRRASSSKAVAGNEKLSEQEIIPIYPWTTTKPAVVCNLRYLACKNINVISGFICCNPCKKVISLEYNLREKFAELSRYIDANEETMRNRASKIWMNPKLTPCESCNIGMKPVTSDEKKEEINWLFLFLGQMLGCCTLEELRYFCDKTKQHQTGAKDRVLYQTYISIYKQLKS